MSPLILDSSMLSIYRKCPQRFFNSFGASGADAPYGLVPTYASIHLHFGSCFALGIEKVRTAFWAGASEGAALEQGLNAALSAFGEDWADIHKARTQPKNSAWSLIRLLLAYFDHWPLSSDPLRPLFTTHSCTEFTFAIPLSAEHLPSPVLYAGRFDLLGALDGVPVVVDEKTTGRRFTSSWGEQWVLRSQFLGYIWALRQMDIDIRHVLVRGCALLTDAEDFTQALLTVPDFLLKRFEEELYTSARAILDNIRDNVFPYNLSDACVDYTTQQVCPFTPLCSAPDRTKWLSLYTPRPAPYSPLREAE